MKTISPFTCFLILILLNISCNKTEDYSQIDEDIIQNYILTNNLNAQSTASGLYYVIDNLGSGDTPTIYSDVTVAYKGYLTNGLVFDESSSSGVTFALGNVIQGWQQGIPFFNEGGSGILLIPSALGYGSEAVGSIPANSVLIFDISLIEVD
jgi:FKBP-type peptidyl-prolyl cis-trans isomerase FkpA